MATVPQLLSTVFRPSWGHREGKIASLTLRYVYISLLNLSVDGEKIVDQGLGKVALELSVSRPTLNKALKELVALGMVAETYSSSSKEKFLSVHVPKASLSEYQDLGQERLVLEALWGDLGMGLGYQQRMVLALLICLSDWKGVVEGIGKERLAQKLGLAERQIRNHLSSLLKGRYLVAYRGGIGGEGRRAGSIALNPEKLFQFGWWDRVDLVTADLPASGPVWWNQQRISPYLQDLMGSEEPKGRLKSGRLVRVIDQTRQIKKGPRAKRSHRMLYDFLLDGVYFPPEVKGQLFSTLNLRQAGLPQPWFQLAPASEGRDWLIDEAFFSLVCAEVMKWKGDLATGSPSRLSIRAVRSIDARLMPLLTSRGEEALGWVQRRWLLQQLRLSLSRMALWSWCCLSSVYRWDIDTTDLSFQLHRVISGRISSGQAVPPVRWLVRFKGEGGKRGQIRSFRVPKKWVRMEL